MKPTIFTNKRRFQNPHQTDLRRGLFDFILWKLGYYNEKPIKVAPCTFRYPNRKQSLKQKDPKVTWLNHCSFLIHLDGMHLLTDPIWSERCSPFSFLGPRRQHKPPIPLHKLPMIDVILISHDHYDHLDRKTVRELNKVNPDTLWIVPKGLKKWMLRQKVKNVVELEWWEEVKLAIEGKPPVELKVTAVPTQHFSGRKLFNRNRTLWVGYVVDFKRHQKPDKRLYFVGDTGYNNKDFKEIGERFESMDLSLIPIGTYVPSKFMNPVHVNPQQSVKIHREVRSKLSIGMHWKTFRLSEEGLNQPPYDLYQVLKQESLCHDRFRVVNPGQTLNW